MMVYMFSHLLDGKELVGPSNISSHFNRTFKGSVESTTELNIDVLYPYRYSMVSFKENVVPKSLKFTGNVDSIRVSKGHSTSKRRGLKGKCDVVCSGESFNKIIRDYKGHFKNFGNTRALCQTQ